MSARGFPNKCGLIAGVAIGLYFAAAPAHAQGVPRGSFLHSCTRVETYGDRLIADCRRTDGSWGRTVLNDVNRCAGDIANMDGQLVCSGERPDYSWRDRGRYSGPGYGGPGYGGSGYGGPGYGGSAYGGPGYGSSGGYWPQPYGYGR